MTGSAFSSPLLQGLEERFRNKGDLPILRDTVVQVMKVTDDQVSGAPALSRVILRDQGLTAKILKVANSVYYNPGDKEINTISRAVVLIGFDMIRTISLGLAFVEMFQKRHPGIDLKGMVARSFIAAAQALEIAQSLRHPDPEEVFISTLLFHLGSLSVAYYLPEVYLQARELESTEGLSSEEAETRVLGFPFHHVGAAFAKEWNLPEGIVETLSHPHFTPGPARTPAERLKGIVCLSNRITDNLLTAGEKDGDLEVLFKALQRTLEIGPEEGVRLVEISYRKAREVSGLFGLEVEAIRPQPEADHPAAAEESPTLRTRTRERLLRICNAVDREEEKASPEESARPKEVKPEEPAAASGQASVPEPSNPPLEERPQETVDPVPSRVEEESPSRAVLQLRFLQEILQHLFGNQDINVLFNMILEGIHRGVGFDRAMLSLLNPKKTRIAGRYSLGMDGEDVAKQLDLPNDPKDNVFGKAFSERQPCFVPDIDAEGIRPLVPEVIRNVFNAKAFAISPIHAQGNVIGFFYADKAATGKTITPEEYQAFLHFALQANLGLERLMTAPRK